MNRVVMIGSGNVATSLALALKDKCEIVQVYSRTLANAESLAERVGALATNDLKALVNNAQVYIISVKDDAIATVVDAIPDNGALWLHTSGSTSVSVLSLRRPLSPAVVQQEPSCLHERGALLCRGL